MQALGRLQHQLVEGDRARHARRERSCKIGRSGPVAPGGPRDRAAHASVHCREQERGERHRRQRGHEQPALVLVGKPPEQQDEHSERKRHDDRERDAP